MSTVIKKAYKAFLRRMGISYIIAGKEQIDYELMLEKLYSHGAKRLMVGGGGTINWSFIQQVLVDEVSMIPALLPTAIQQPPVSSAREPNTTPEDKAFDLAHMEHLGDGVVWLRYTPKSA